MSSFFFSAIFEKKGHEARWTRRVKLSRTLGKDYQVHRQLSKKSCRSRGSRSSSALCASVRALLLHKRERSLLVIGNSHKDMSVSRLSKLERSLHERESSLLQARALSASHRQPSKRHVVQMTVGVRSSSESSLPTKRQRQRRKRRTLFWKLFSLCIGQRHPVRYQSTSAILQKNGISV